MSDTDQTKDTEVPTVLQTLGAGITTGLVGGLIFFLVMTIRIHKIAYRPPPLADLLRENFMEYFFGDGLPGIVVVLIACSIGAFVARAKAKSLRRLWVGAIIALLISGPLVLCALQISLLP